MNSVEKKYACSRLDLLEAQRVQAVKEQFTTPGKQLTPAQRAALVRGKKLPFQDFKQLDIYARVDKIFDFSQHEFPEKLNTADFNKARDRIQKEAAQARDLIMLGNPEQALVALSKFAKDS